MPIKKSESIERRDELVVSAFELFSRSGIGNVRMDDIAKHASVTKGSLYHHFKSKKEVVLASCDYYYQLWMDLMHREVRGVESVSQKLERSIYASVQSCLVDSQNRVFTLEIMALALHDEDLRQSWASFSQMARNYYVGLLRQLVDAQSLAAGHDCESRVDLMLCAMEGIKQNSFFAPEASLLDDANSLTKHLLNIVTPITE